MGYNDGSEYPKGKALAASLTTTPQTLYAGKAKVSHFVVGGGAADEIVIFRAVDDSPEYMRVPVLAGTTVVVPGFEIGAEGLEVVTASLAGDVTVAAFHFTG